MGKPGVRVAGAWVSITIAPRPSTIPWNDLASGLDGKVVLPGSGEYESSYPTFIKRFDHIRPAGVVIAENEADREHVERVVEEVAVADGERRGPVEMGENPERQRLAPGAHQQRAMKPSTR